MRNKQNPKKIMNPNINLEQIDAEPFEETKQTQENSRNDQEEFLPVSKDEPSPTKGGAVILTPSTKPIGIGSRLHMWDRQPPSDWQKPWEPTNTQTEDMANSAHKPHAQTKKLHGSTGMSGCPILEKGHTRRDDEPPC